MKFITFSRTTHESAPDGGRDSAMGKLIETQ